MLFGVLGLAAIFALQSTGVALPETANPPTQQSQPSTQQDPAAQSNPMSEGAETQVFTGKIAKAGGKYVLKDSATKMSYSLDDQSQAKKFEGQSVKVTGMLDAQSNIIHVSLIEPGS
ncbi:MAG TPA: DUF5818 domain-containing protein, partial [Terriglobales bacterium]